MLFNIGRDEMNRRSESREQFKRRVARILCLLSLAKFDYSLYFYFYKRKQNKRVYALHCDIIAIKEHCCWLIFFKIKYSVYSFSIFNRQLLAAKK